MQILNTGANGGGREVEGVASPNKVGGAASPNKARGVAMQILNTGHQWEREGGGRGRGKERIWRREGKRPKSPKSVGTAPKSPSSSTTPQNSQILPKNAPRGLRASSGTPKRLSRPQTPPQTPLPPQNPRNPPPAHPATPEPHSGTFPKIPRSHFFYYYYYPSQTQQMKKKKKSRNKKK